MIERITRLEANVDHVSKTVDEIRQTQIKIVAAMDEARGQAKAAKAIGHTITAFVAFAVSQFGGFLHLR